MSNLTFLNLKSKVVLITNRVLLLIMNKFSLLNDKDLVR